MSVCCFLVIRLRPCLLDQNTALVVFVPLRGYIWKNMMSICPSLMSRFLLCMVFFSANDTQPLRGHCKTVQLLCAHLQWVILA